MGKGARTGNVLLHHVSAVALLFSILLLSLASDRFHNHYGRAFDGESRR